MTNLIEEARKILSEDNSEHPSVSAHKRIEASIAKAGLTRLLSPKNPMHEPGALIWQIGPFSSREDAVEAWKKLTTVFRSYDDYTLARTAPNVVVRTFSFKIPEWSESIGCSIEGWFGNEVTQHKPAGYISIQANLWNYRGLKDRRWIKE